MNIQEATKLAMENGKSLYRSSQFDRDAKPGSTVEFIPTNSHGYIVTVPNQKAFTPLWQPMAEDLLADDWKVVGYENKKPQTTQGNEQNEESKFDLDANVNLNL